MSKTWFLSKEIVNDTNKTQYLFRIEKGVLDINDQGVNDYFSPKEVRVPFRNMVYIGDSDTEDHILTLPYQSISGLKKCNGNVKEW